MNYFITKHAFENRDEEKRGDPSSAARTDEADDQRVMDPPEPRIMAPSLELPVPAPCTSPPNPPPQINIHHTPKRTKQSQSLQLTYGLVDPPDPRSTRERACRADGSSTGRTQKGDGAIEAITGRLPHGQGGQGGGSAEVHEAVA